VTTLDDKIDLIVLQIGIIICILHIFWKIFIILQIPFGFTTETH